jgi:hypothetical protein
MQGKVDQMPVTCGNEVKVKNCKQILHKLWIHMQFIIQRGLCSYRKCYTTDLVVCIIILLERKGEKLINYTSEPSTDQPSEFLGEILEHGMQPDI